MYKYFRFESVSIGYRVNETERIVVDEQIVKVGFSKNFDHPDIYTLSTPAQ